MTNSEKLEPENFKIIKYINNYLIYKIIKILILYNLKLYTKNKFIN